MHARKKISVITILLIGVGLGYLIKNVKVGLVIGLMLGLLSAGLINSKK